MYLLLFKHFLRSKTCQLGILLILVMGIISIAVGKQFLDNNQKVTTELVEKQKAHIDRNVALHKEDPGLLLYYLKFTLVNELNPLAGLSIGQRDLNPGIQNVSILTLEGQKYNSDLVNPVRLLFGNFDFSFLLVYMFPLLIIAFTYNLLSEEKEKGTWNMIRVAAQSRVKFLLVKLSVRIIVVIGLMSILLLTAAVFMSISFNSSLLVFYLIALLYLLFWFAISFWLMTLGLTSGFNALSLLSVWLLLVVLAPSIVNSAITNAYPIPEAFATMIKQRDGYHVKWDEAKRPTMEQFYAIYPQYKKYGYPPEEGFNWLWYYAMQHAGDVESQQESAAMMEKIVQRETLSKKISGFFPSMQSLLVFNELAETSLQNHLSFLNHTNKFHEDIRLFFYPKIFENEKLDKIDWTQFLPANFKVLEKPLNWGNTFGPLILGILLFAGLSIPFMKKNL